LKKKQAIGRRRPRYSLDSLRLGRIRYEETTGLDGQTGGLLPNQQREREPADEIESHLQLHIEDNLRLGMTEEQARRSALLQLGGVESTKENYRERSTVPFVEHTLQDVRFAVRQLRKSAGFNFAAIFMLRRSAASLPRPGDDWNPDTDVPVVS
jgi:hypothetical protein